MEGCTGGHCEAPWHRSRCGLIWIKNTGFVQVERRDKLFTGSDGCRHEPARGKGGSGDSCFTCQMRPASEWGVLQEDEVSSLNDSKICNTYRPGQIIFYQGNPCLGVYCIESGTIAIRKTDAAGNSVLVRLAHEGQTLGYRTYFSGGGYTASAEALTEARICFVDRAAVRRLLDLNPALGMRFLKRISDDLRDSEDQRLAAASLPVRARVAHLLLVLKDRCATVDEDGTLVIELPLARQDIAAMLGTRPETIARTTKALEEDGVAEFRGRHVLVQDLDMLLDEVEQVSAR